jgi:hypothetical protein
MAEPGGGLPLRLFLPATAMVDINSDDIQMSVGLILVAIQAVELTGFSRRLPHCPFQWCNAPDQCLAVKQSRADHKYSNHDNFLLLPIL